MLDKELPTRGFGEGNGRIFGVSRRFDIKRTIFKTLSPFKKARTQNIQAVLNRINTHGRINLAASSIWLRTLSKHWVITMGEMCCLIGRYKCAYKLQEHLANEGIIIPNLPGFYQTLAQGISIINNNLVRE